MKQLITLIDVNHADPTKKLTGGTKLGIVTMTIEKFSYRSDLGIEIPFYYSDADGNKLDTTDYPDGVFRLTAEQTKAVSESIHPLLPEDNNIEDRMWNEVIIVAKNHFSGSFGITPAEIALVISE